MCTLVNIYNLHWIFQYLSYIIAVFQFRVHQWAFENNFIRFFYSSMGKHFIWDFLFIQTKPTFYLLFMVIGKICVSIANKESVNFAMLNKPLYGHKQNLAIFSCILVGKFTVQTSQCILNVHSEYIGPFFKLHFHSSNFMCKFTLHNFST